MVKMYEPFERLAIVGLDDDDVAGVLCLFIL